MTKKDLLSIIGFIFFLVGLLSLALGMVGIEFSFLPLSKVVSPLAAGIIRVIIFITGIALIYISKYVLDSKE